MIADNQVPCRKCAANTRKDPDGPLCPRCAADFLGASQTVGGDPNASHPLPFTPPDVAELAPLFPHLDIYCLIGRGGMGAVYKARQKRLDRVVALKILPPAIGLEPTFAGRFTREARALARLDHPGIVTVHDFGSVPWPESDTDRSDPAARLDEAAPTAYYAFPRPLPKKVPDCLYYLLMEYVDGVHLRRLLELRPIAAREALAIVPQICDALQFAHDNGIVHRDIKPENILLDRKGRVKVADFGLVKLISHRTPNSEQGGESTATTDHTSLAPCDEDLSDARRVLGTPHYMAPEQRERPGEVDHRADIFALGVVFYQMLTGELPDRDFRRPSEKVKVDVRLDEVVLKALEAEPSARYQRVSDVKTDLDSIVTAPTDHQPGNTPGLLGAELRPFRDRFAASAIALCGVLGLLISIPSLLERNGVTNAFGILTHAAAVHMMFLPPWLHGQLDELREITVMISFALLLACARAHAVRNPSFLYTVLALTSVYPPLFPTGPILATAAALVLRKKQALGAFSRNAAIHRGIILRSPARISLMAAIAGLWTLLGIAYTCTSVAVQLAGIMPAASSSHWSLNVASILNLLFGFPGLGCAAVLAWLALDDIRSSAGRLTGIGTGCFAVLYLPTERSLFYGLASTTRNASDAALLATCFAVLLSGSGAYFISWITLRSGGHPNSRPDRLIDWLDRRSSHLVLTAAVVLSSLAFWRSGLAVDLLNSPTTRMQVHQSDLIRQSSTDLWDMENGVQITRSSNPDRTSNLSKMFGAESGSTEATRAVFSDGSPDGTIHFIEWTTPSPVTVRSLRLMIAHDPRAWGVHRAISHFRLIARSDQQVPEVTVASIRVPYPYIHGDSPTCIELRHLNPITCSRFRAEFTQHGENGPRIIELDAFRDETPPHPSERVLISPPGSTFTNHVAVTLKATDTKCDLRYTTDGTIPAHDSTPYTTVLSLNKSTDLAVRGFIDHLPVTEVVRAHYGLSR